MVVNHQGEQAQRLHAVLAQRLSGNITLYQQDSQQPDIWKTLSGQKDDFLVYDRCGRLTHHISLPYSIIGQGHIENAIKETYCKRICGDCIHESAESLEECRETSAAQPGADGTTTVEEDTPHGHSHDHGYGHHHGHHHGHHGDNNAHPHGFGHGRDHNHGHHHGNHDVAGHGHDHGQSQHAVRHHEQDDGLSQRQHPLDLGQMQQAVHVHEIPQQAHATHVRP
ncbi:Selenoprotein Pa [Channa argus]|uniref:Selenoprotein Pa n=4 Tax=Channa argus TaxID=215402 RepID=A0A6G1PZJ5_CHAAH|nr:Selenoprotein Pa [Channa argus]